jgi:hypothetical protein
LGSSCTALTPPTMVFPVAVHQVNPPIPKMPLTFGLERVPRARAFPQLSRHHPRCHRSKSAWLSQR